MSTLLTPIHPRDNSSLQTTKKGLRFKNVPLILAPSPIRTHEGSSLETKQKVRSTHGMLHPRSIVSFYSPVHRFTKGRQKKTRFPPNLPPTTISEMVMGQECHNGIQPLKNALTLWMAVNFCVKEEEEEEEEEKCLEESFFLFGAENFIL